MRIVWRLFVFSAVVGALLGARTASAQVNGAAPPPPEPNGVNGMVPAEPGVVHGWAAAPYGGCNTCCPSYRQDGWMMHFDWLHWRASRGGLDFAIADAGVDPIGPGAVKRINQDWENGFRFGIFRQTANGWDFGFRYTHLDAEGSGSLVDPNGFSSATRVHPALFGLGAQDVALAVSRYDVDYRLYDIEAGYRFDVNCNALVRPFLGIRWAEIDQRLTTVYSDTVDFSGAIDGVRERLDMDSIGLYSGAEGRWNLGGSGLHLFGRGAAGLHLGRFRGSVVQADLVGETIDLSVSDHSRRVVASLEAQAGLGYTLHESCRGNAAVQVGYEIHKWFNMADFIRFHDNLAIANMAANDSSIGFDGLFVRLMLTR